MRRRLVLAAVMAGLCAGCTTSANIEQERTNLMAVDREWSQTTKDTDKFLTYYAADASVYPQGMPIATGSAQIRDTFTKLTSTPGFSLTWTASKGQVSAAGDVGYTTGAYQMTMNDAAGSPVTDKGKYITIWKKVDGQWKVVEDIFNSDAASQSTSTSSQHVLVTAGAVTWGPAPPSLAAPAKMAVISGDPGKAGAFALRLQFPAGYKVASHWHPTDEHVTVLSGTLAVGMGESFDQAALKDMPAGGYALLPAEMRHFAMAKTATIIQLHGTGPFVLNYVNPADDPSQQKK